MAAGANEFILAGMICFYDSPETQTRPSKIVMRFIGILF